MRISDWSSDGALPICHQLLDHRRVLAAVDVVDDLCALVAGPAVVLEADGAFHGEQPTCGRETGTESRSTRCPCSLIAGIADRSDATLAGQPGGTTTRKPAPAVTYPVSPACPADTSLSHPPRAP